NFPTSRFWVFNGGVPAISTQKVQDVTFPGVGVFTVELYVSNAAGSDTAVYQQYIEVVSSVDVEDELAAMGLKLYPNPTQGEISLEMNLEGGEDIAVEIYDITGRKLAQLLNTTASAGASKWNFDLSQTGANQAALILSISVDGKQSRRLVQVTR
ncbi:MAG: T9SS type A sorting domain-containing protein, partial [Bacteroidota bacterium]